MFSLFNILEKTFLNEDVNRKEIESAISNRRRVALSYEGDPEHGVASGVRYVDVYSLIETSAGNIAIRGYQPFGDTASSTPAWKIFRVDRITDWVETPHVFKEPAPGFNPNGDLGANRVLMMAQFGNKLKNMLNQPQQKVTADKVFKTDTERELRTNLDTLRKKLDKPKFLDQYMDKPKQPTPADTITVGDTPDEMDTNPLKTDTEMDINSLKTDTEMDMESLGNEKDETNSSNNNMDDIRNEK